MTAPAITGRRPALGRRPAPGLGACLLWGLVAAAVALALAPLGMTALYAVAGVVGLGVVAYLLRDDLKAPVLAAVRRVMPEPVPSRSGTLSPRTTGLLVTAGVASAGLAWVVATQGTMEAVALFGLVVMAAVLTLFWPLVTDLVTGSANESIRFARPAGLAGSRTAPTARPSRITGIVGVLVVGAGGAGVAWMAATMGKKGLLAVVGGIVVVGLFTIVRDRSVFFTFVTVCSLTFVMHKSIGPQDLQLSSGAISVYITTFDVLLVLLYGLWIREGTFVEDVKAVLREPILWFPLVGALLLLPSLLVAPTPLLSMAEIVRMGWMYLLYVYVALRVRTRRHIWAILAGLVVFVAVELVVVVLQWRTGGVLGLDFLGVPTTLGERVTDAGVLGRPFGTIILPVFMGAALGMVGLLALAFAVELKRSLTKLTAVVVFLACVACLYISNTRASLVAAGAAALVIVVVGVRRGSITWPTLGRIGMGLGAVALAFYPQLSAKIEDSFSSGHFFTEVESRLEMNDIAGRIIADHPVLGVGLNNFEVILPRYEASPVIFFGHPVHNLYLLVLAETGIVGLVGLVLVGVGLYDAAIRVARGRDPLLRTVGIGVAAAMGFMMLEELLGFSLRQDIPLALYWLLGGLVAAAARMSAMPWPAIARADLPSSRPARPGRSARSSVAAPGPRRRMVGVLSVAALMATSGSLSEVPTASAGSAIDQGAEETQPSGDGSVVTIADASTVAATGAVLTDGSGTAPATEATGVVTDGTLDPSAPLEGLQPGEGAGVSAVAGGDQQGVPGPSVAEPAQTPGAPTADSAQTPASLAGTAGSADAAGLVFSATERSTGIQGVYVAGADGEPRRVTPADGRFYSWPRWAFGNTRIVYTVRSGPPGSPEAIALMKPDGSDPQVLQSFDFRVAQPTVDPTGQFVVFTATAPWFPEVAVFRLDLATGESTNLTAVTTGFSGFDSDPAVSPRGDGIVFVWTTGTGASVAEMAPDGASRRLITDDEWFNTDPGVSPDGSQVVLASYRGSGTPSSGVADDVTAVKTGNWHVVLESRSGGAQTVLTEGLDCASRSPQEPCSVPQMSGFVPRFTPDGASITFTGAADSRSNCICAIGVDGSDPRAIVSSTELAIDWYDWPQPPGAETSTADVGAGARSSELLVVMAELDGTRSLVRASPDLMHREVIALPKGVQPLEARWAADGRTMLLTLEVPVGAAQAPHPAAPAGRQRRAHATLEDLDSIATSLRAERVSAMPDGLAQRQVFLRAPDGTLTQVTDPWIEDWRDGLVRGDARANTDPVMTPDGRSVIVTNTSTTTGESFLLRIDLETGGVLNLTNGSAGAMPTDDAEPTVSPDGTQVAFSWTQGSNRGLYVMDTASGTRVSAMTTQDGATTMPAWAPDGRSLVYVADRPGGPVVVRAPLSGRLTTGAETVVGPGGGLNPLVAPEGDRVVFRHAAAGVLGLYAASMHDPGAPRLVQPDGLHSIIDLDWR